MKTKEEILEYIEDIDLSLMLLEDTMKGQIGDAITKARGQLEDIRKYHASQFQQEWIPVEVRLPEENIPVLCTNVNGFEDVELLTIGLRYKDSTSFYLTEINQPTDQVTHWMPFPPLPQPYNPTKS